MEQDAGYVALLAGERALVDRADLAAARPHFEAAGRAALADGDAELLARAALGLGGLWVHEHRTAVEAARLGAWLRKARNDLPPESPLVPRIEARLAAEQDYTAGTADGILAAVERARGGTDPVALAEALSLAHHCLLAPAHAARRLALADELLTVAAVTDRPLDTTIGLLWRTVDMLLQGDPHAERSLRELRGLTERHSLRAVEFVLDAQEVMLAIRRGELEAAEARAGVALERGREAGDLDAVGWYAAQLVAVRWFQDRIGELLPFLDDMAHSPTLAGPDNSLFSALAVAAATIGDRPLAVQALRRVRGAGLASLPSSSTWLVTLAGVAEAAALLGDAELAAETYALLEPYAPLPVMASLGIVCFGSAHHPLGVAALAMGRLPQAVNHFAEATAAEERLGHRPAADRSRRRLAEARALADKAADKGAAVCRREQSGWAVELAGRSVTVPDSVGMAYLAVLLGSPGQEIAAVRLAGRIDLTGGPAQAVLDEGARQSYAARIRALQVELDAADAAADPARGARAEEELQWLVAELDRATGLSGRPRPFADEAERARTSVRKAIRRAIDRVTAADRDVGEELAATVVTGTRCSYRPRSPGLPQASGSRSRNKGALESR